MLEVKNTVTEMKNTFGGLRVELTLSQWIWRYVNKNFPNWNAKRKKKNDTIQELRNNYGVTYV